MKVRSNLFRYLHGGVIGMCAEYMYRVEVSIWPLVVMCATLGLIIIDLTTKQDDK